MNQRRGIGCGSILLGAVVVSLSLVYWRISLPLLLVAGAVAVGVRQMRRQRARATGVVLAKWWQLPEERWEQEVPALLERLGWTKIEWVGDEGGAEIVGTDRARRRTVVLVRHWAPSAEVGPAVIEVAVACVHAYKVDRALVVTTGLFSAGARALAAAYDVELADGATLASWSGKAMA